MLVAEFPQSTGRHTVINTKKSHYIFTLPLRYHHNSNIKSQQRTELTITFCSVERDPIINYSFIYSKGMGTFSFIGSSCESVQRGPGATSLHAPATQAARKRSWGCWNRWANSRGTKNGCAESWTRDDRWGRCRSNSSREKLYSCLLMSDREQELRVIYSCFKHENLLDPILSPTDKDIPRMKQQ